MQQAIPYKSWRSSLHTTPSRFTQSSPLIAHNVDPALSLKGHTKLASTENMAVVNMVSENAVIVIARRGCCMSHVMKRLLLGLGVNPAVYEVDEKDEMSVVSELEAITANHKGSTVVHGKVQLPAVFIGGKMFGGLDRLMATHISGELTPILKEAGALWL